MTPVDYEEYVKIMASAGITSPFDTEWLYRIYLADYNSDIEQSEKLIHDYGFNKYLLVTGRLN